MCGEFGVLVIEEESKVVEIGVERSVVFIIKVKKRVIEVLEIGN